MKKAILPLFMQLLLICNAAPVRAAAPKKPKLVLAVVVDQFRYDYLVRFRKDYNAGFARLLEQGAVFSDAHHIAAPTVTAIGHSTFLSGATPSLSGIVGNEWFDRASKGSVTSVSDEGTKLLGGPAGRIGSSPNRLLVSTVGDEIKMQGQDSRVIGVSIKDRSAILPVGHMADGAYWFDPDSNNWVSSTYYMKELPPWVQELNRKRPASRAFGQSWRPFDAKDDSVKPFCTMVAGADVPFCNSLEATPWGNEVIEEFAEQAIASEKMGLHSGTDILAVSFSANDYVGHALGPDSPEVRDISIRTDRMLGRLLDAAEKQAGAGNVLLVLTADHGVSPVPELNLARKMPGGRLSDIVLGQAVDSALATKYGPGKWVLARSSGSMYLNTELIQSHKLDEAEVEQTAANALRALPHTFRVYTGEDLTNGRVPNDTVTDAVRNGFMRQRSADIYYVSDPFYIFGDTGTTHGGPFNYDTHVPVIFMGAGIKAGQYYGRVAVNDIAPTLTAILGVPIPSGSVGRVLSEMFE